MAGFPGTGHAAIAQGLIEAGGENGALFRTGNHRGRQEEALEQTGHKPQVGADLLTQTGGRQPVGAPGHAFPGAADVAADGGQTAAGILDQGAHHHIRPHVGGLHGFHKFAVAVVHHDLHIGLAGLAEGNQLADLCHGEGGPGGVALGALNGNELGFFVDGGPNSIVVKFAAGEQIHLPVGNPVLCQGAGAFPDADDLLQGVVGQPYRGQ